MLRRMLGVAARKEGVYIMVHDRLSTATTTQSASSAALYIHWPFCKKKCPYCDFNSHVREGVDHAAWRAALLREMGYWHARAPHLRIGSIFFGGGTPSLMEAETVAAVIEEAQRLWPPPLLTSPQKGEERIEITLEANPTSVEAEKFHAFRAAGVNRVSLGVQSLRPESLAFLGREHSAGEALSAVALAAEIFPRYSFDLIYALPNQTLNAWENELKEALTHARGHLSLYQLTIEENTAFHHAYHIGKSFQLPEEGIAADLYALTQSIMEGAGLPAYEISNHATPGQESLHNLAYWRGHSYVGIGPGAHGRVNVAPDTRLATNNLKSPERWLESVARLGHGLAEETALTTEQRAEEKILMGLRLPREGIDLATLPAPELTNLTTRWADGRLEPLITHGLIEKTGSTLRATDRGIPVLNSIIEQLLT